MPIDAKVFDEGQLTLVKRAAVKLTPKDTGGPMHTPRLPGGPRR